jgi:hydroxypyruvate reductase 1
LDENTKHLINKQRLSMMKEDALLVNAARGPCIDEAALVEHMKAHPNFRAGEASWGDNEAEACVL